MVGEEVDGVGAAEAGFVGAEDGPWEHWLAAEELAGQHRPVQCLPRLRHLFGDLESLLKLWRSIGTPLWRKVCERSVFSESGR